RRPWLVQRGALGGRGRPGGPPGVAAAAPPRSGTGCALAPSGTDAGASAGAAVAVAPPASPEGAPDVAGARRVTIRWTALLPARDCRPRSIDERPVWSARVR